MDSDVIARINELAHKAKSLGLTDEEREEQATLRRIYIEEYRRSLISELDSITIIDEKGNRHKLVRKNDL